MQFEPFYVGTCEGRLEDARRIPFEPNPNDPAAPFEVSDPFGVRRAVLPVFREDSSGELYGQGTAFHVDGSGGLLTAEHVIDFSRVVDMRPGMRHMDGPPNGDHPVVMLSPGLVFGQVAVPPWALLRVSEQRWLVDPAQEDPLSFYRGQPTHRVAVDVAAMRLNFDSEHPAASLPLALRKWSPVIGEPVLAMGYPELMPNDHAIDRERLLIVDRLFGAYGAVTNVHPTGSSSSNPTPVFEVEANWPSGMSGGPVFNRAGHVIGVVSRSIAPADGLPGVGYAAAVGHIGGLSQLLPTVHPTKPGWRVGFAVIQEVPFALNAMFPDLESASRRCEGLGPGHKVRRGSLRIGTRDFEIAFAAFGS